MFHLVPGAFLAAGIANRCAERTDLSSELAVTCHHRRGKLTKGSAVDVECDAARHHLDVLFLQAGGGALIALNRAVVARLDTGFVLFLGHENLWVD